MKTKISVVSILFLLLISSFSLSQNVVSIRLGPSTGEDCMLASYIATTPLPDYPDIIAAAWTYGGEFNLWRPLFKFNLEDISPGAIIANAKLSLYANPGNVNYPHTGQNKSYIRKVTTNWNANTATWENQPEFSTEDQVALAESISPDEDYLDIDVTELVRDMVSDPSTNFGFMLMLRTEYYYRCINFASSECPDINKRPKLDISYTESSTGIDPVQLDIPVEFKLSQNFPNPFNPVTNIKFDISKFSYTSLKIFDELGKEVTTLVNENLNPGRYEVQWNGSNFSSGVYFMKIESDNKIITKRIMLIK